MKYLLVILCLISSLAWGGTYTYECSYCGGWEIEVDDTALYTSETLLHIEDNNGRVRKICARCWIDSMDYALGQPIIDYDVEVEK